VQNRRIECATCGKVKQETLDWHADNPFYTKRFAFFVGRRCRTMTIKAIDEQYMQEQLRRAGTPAPKVIRIDEISIRRGHTYRIVLSDLARRRPIWFGGKDRSEASKRWLRLVGQYVVILKWCLACVAYAAVRRAGRLSEYT
jgi:transposase